MVNTSGREVEKILNFLEDRYKDKVDNKSDGKPFKTLVSTILSQRTREENTAKASKKLFSVAETPEEILELERKRLQDLIRPSGFYRQKADYIRETCKILLEKYDGKVPEDREELMKLPGVGYKTSNVVLVYGHGEPAIPVDTHVETVSKRLGLVKKEANVEQVRERLEELFPRDKWYLLNFAIVLFGREICKPQNPKCEVCDLSSICRYYKENIS